MPDDLLQLANEAGWFLPFLALILPIPFILLVALGKVIYALGLAAQLAIFTVTVRLFTRHLRRSGFTGFQVKIMLGPLYLIMCFASNLIILVIMGLAHRAG